jgi:hypothetical protein
MRTRRALRVIRTRTRIVHTRVTRTIMRVRIERRF